MEKAYVGSADGKPAYGRRVFVNLVDEIATCDPSRTLIAIPRSTDPNEGWQDLTFGQYANAVNRLSHWIAEKLGVAVEGEFPTMAYIGPNDVRYLIILAAAVKAGYKILFISPRNNFESQLSLFAATGCNWLCYTPEYSQKVQPWLTARPMNSRVIGAVSDLLDMEQVPAFPYRKSFAEACWDPAMILHTSGSTGTPKPIVCRHGMIALGDAYHEQPELSGYSHIMKAYSEKATRVLCAMPMFHALGIYFYISLSIYWGTPLLLPIAGQVLTTDTIRVCLERSSADAAILPPSILADMSYDKTNIEALNRLSFVTTGGGNLEDEAGDRLVDAGVKISNGISSTEYGVYPIYFQPNTKLWKYFIFNNDIFGCEYRLVEENIYEQIIIRRAKEPGLQGIFYTLPDLEKYYTKDLYQPHPTLAHHWIHLGRADDVIVFSNGEKLNPVTIETTVGSHPDVKRAIVVGQGKFQAGLILEPVHFPADDTMAQNLIGNIWPTIERVNRETVAHGRIAKHMVQISDRAKPIPYSSKGSLQRGQFLKLYEREIEALYDTDDRQETVHLNFESKDSLSKSLEDIVRSLWAVSDLGPDTDFFNAGLDSLQAINFARLLGYGVRQAGFPAERCQITPRLIYANPTLRRLTEYLFLQSSHEASESSHTWEGVEEAETLLDKYSIGSKDKTVQTKLLPADQEQIILLTGSTGSLGSYLLDLLEGCTSVSQVICLNRAPDGGLSKQIQSSKERGLRTKFVKTEFIQADLSQPHLGINEVTYARLLASVDRIIHNAWPVNFNMFVGTFEPSIKGVRHMADFSFRASKRVPIIFISSIATVGHWTYQKPVPESLLTDMSLASPGYGQSKLIGDLVLSQGAEKLGLPISVLRVGQIAGSRSEQGIWNAHEWLPTIIASSLNMGRLPSDLGTLDMVDWVCIEDVAATVLEIAGITCRQPLSKISGHFNVVNPTRLQWRELALSVQEHYEQQGRKLELVSLASWVGAIEESMKYGTETPAVKLLDTFRSMLAKTPKECTTFSTARTASLSPTLSKIGPLNTQMMKLWCRQWGF